VGPSWLRRLTPWLVLAVACATATPAYAPPEPRRSTAPALAPPPAPDQLRIDFIAVGQGDAALVTSPTGKTVLIDGGPIESAAALTTFLRARVSAPLDLALLTHRHDDHFGGFTTVIRTIGIRQFIDAPIEHRGSAYTKLLEALAAKGIPVRNATRGRIIDLGAGATVTLLSPPDPPIAGGHSKVNANSVIARLDYRGLAVLFAADAEPETERWLLLQDMPLQARILKVAHHGARFSSTAKFLAAVRPALAVISAGDNNIYGHPTPQALGRLDQVGARVFRTDRDGTITIVTDGGRIDVSSERGQHAVLSPP
jgi:competence protein ComEC